MDSLLTPAFFGTMAAALVAGLFSFLSLVIAKENKVSEFRQAWIDAFRQDLARYSSAVLSLAHGAKLDEPQPGSDAKEALKPEEYFKLLQPSYDAAMSAQTSFYLRINRSEKHEPMKTLNEKLVAHVKSIQAAINKENYSDAKHLAASLHEVAAPVLKCEWERVKSGEPIYEKAKQIALVVAIASAAFVIFAGVSLTLRPCRSVDQAVSVSWTSTSTES